MYTLQCKQCDSMFEAKAANRLYCSVACKKDKYKQIKKLRAVVRVCKQCKKEYSRILEKKGFCTISCGSKWNIEHGVSDAWRLRVQEKTGIYVKCHQCGKGDIYIIPGHIKKTNMRFCNVKCKSSYMSNIFSGKGNPMYGKKLSLSALKKQKATLLRNHGVENAFFLAKHKIVSGPQRELYELLNKKFKKDKFELEKRIKIKKKNYIVDIYSKKRNIAIEFNGDYWHCNPRTYNENYYNSVKRQTAKVIWAYDKKKVAAIKSHGIKTCVVWEYDFLNNREKTMRKLFKFVGCREDKENVLNG